MFKLLVCVAVILTVTSANYDFKDSDFNELLFDDLRTDFDDELADPMRLKRDTDVTAQPKECHRRKERDMHCCNGDKIDPKQHEVLKEVKKQCIAEIRGDNGDEPSFDPFDCEKMQVLKEQMVCTAECVAKKFNLLDESGALRRDVLLAHLRVKVGENKWMAKALEGYVDKCLGELKASAKDNEEKKTDSKKVCNQCPLQFTHCIWREFAQGCPPEQQVDSGKCKKIRERLSKGDTSHLNKSFLHYLHSHHDEKKDSA